ncbi:MAG: hypothetical protein V4581_02065 [Bacteroidota bacterium]
MENKQDIGKAFRDKLDGFYKEPNDAVWQNINASLQQNKRGGFRMPFWGRATAIVLGVIMLAVFTHPLWQDYMPEIIIKMPNDKPDGATGNGTNANGTQPSATVTTGTESPEQQENTNTTTTAGAPRSQDAATVSTDGVNSNAVQQNNSATNNNNVTTGSNATGTNVNNTTAVGASNKNSIKTAATANGLASGKIHSNNTKAGQQATGKPLQNNRGVASNKANSTSAVKGPSATTNKHAASNTIANNNNAAAKTKVANNNSATVAKPTTGNTTATTNSNNNATAKTKVAEGNSATAAISTTGNTTATANNSQSQKAATSVGSTTKTAGAKAQNTKDINILYSAGNYPTITKALADSLVLAQKAIDYKESKERTYAKPAFTAADSLTGGDGYSKGFYVFAYVAPSNYKFGESTSVIDPSLNSNASSAETSTNFGAYVGYEFSSQFSLRAGISSTKMVQNTGNVTLGGNYSGVDYTNGMDNTSANIALGGGPVTLRQKSTFIEVPIEATYAMFGTRADLYFKGGFSTLFLQDNELYAQNNQGSVLLGSLNHTKDFSMSGNLGIGFYYKFTRELQLNVEPGVKYYFNTFDNVSPWSLSVQAGLLYRF